MGKTLTNCGGKPCIRAMFYNGQVYEQQPNTNLDLEEMSKKLDEALANMTQEEIDKYFPPDTRLTF